MLGLLVLAGLATASVLPDMLVSKVDADPSGDDPSDAEMEQGDEGNILDTFEPAEAFAAEPADAALVEAGDVLSFDATAGTHLVQDFNADTDWLVVSLPTDSEDLSIEPADPESDTLPLVSWEQEDGLVELRFDGLDDVPVERISLLFDGLDYEIALGDVIAAQEEAFTALAADDALSPTDPEAAAISARTGAPDSDGDALSPTDPEAASLPADGGAPVVEADVLSPTDPEAPNVPDDAADSPGDTLADIVADPDILPDGSDTPDDTPRPEIIRDFTPGEDILVLDGDPGSVIDTVVAPDGSGTHVYVDDQWVATVIGVTEIDPGDIVFEQQDAPVAA